MAGRELAYLDEYFSVRLVHLCANSVNCSQLDLFSILRAKLPVMVSARLHVGKYEL